MENDLKETTQEQKMTQEQEATREETTQEPEMTKEPGALNPEDYQQSQNTEDNSEIKEESSDGMGELITVMLAQITSQRYPEEQRQEYINKYVSFTAPWLNMLQIDESLAELNITKLKPTHKLIIAGVILAGGAVMCKPTSYNKDNATQQKEE